MRAAGRSVYYQPAATIVHFEGQTSGTDETSGVKQHQVVNRETFARKWAGELAGAPVERPTRLRSSATAGRAGGCWSSTRACSRPTTTRARCACWRSSSSWASWAARSTFVADNLEYREPYVRDLQQRGVEVLFHPYVTSIAELLAHARREFDLIVVRRATTSPRSTSTRCAAFAPQALLVFDTVDLHFLRAERQASSRAARRPRAQATATRELELDLVRGADVTLVVSPVERELLAASWCRPRACDVLSNIHELMPRRQAVRRARGPRVHRRLPASAQHRRRALVRAGDPAARARGCCPAS
ncbi:glycosyltransferase family 2 protein [Methanothrix soehngenii]|uniref:glycosyltransferase family 2 protein n=1 Tax=Methanothrix soehngenii TaxID=2223 RepID=UPI003AB9327C